MFGNNLQNFNDCEVVSIEIPHGEWWMVECLKYGSQSVLKKVEGGWVNCCFDFQLHEPAASYKDDEMKPLYLMVRESV